MHTILQKGDSIIMYIVPFYGENIIQLINIK